MYLYMYVFMYVFMYVYFIIYVCLFFIFFGCRFVWVFGRGGRRGPLFGIWIGDFDFFLLLLRCIFFWSGGLFWAFFLGLLFLGSLWFLIKVYFCQCSFGEGLGTFFIFLGFFCFFYLGFLLLFCFLCLYFIFLFSIRDYFI